MAQIEALSAARHEYLNNINLLEPIEKRRRIEDSVYSRKVLLWSELDDPHCIDVNDIKLSNEEEIRREAKQAIDEEVTREFKLYRERAEADYRANVRFVNGESIGEDVCVGSSTVFSSLICGFSPEVRLERLRQDELRKIGESDVQKVARFIPVVGSAMDYHYDRISKSELCCSIGADVALLGVGRCITGTKALMRVRFSKNLSAQINKVPHGPRAWESFLKLKYPESSVTSTTLPKTNGPNVKKAGESVNGIPFDAKGMPIFDKVLKCEVMLPEEIVVIQNREEHFRAATRALRELINKGKVNKHMFNANQLDSIYRGDKKIPKYTWHHHQDRGRMQVVPEDVHGKIGHVGGYSLWFE